MIGVRKKVPRRACGEQDLFAQDPREKIFLG